MNEWNVTSASQMDYQDFGRAQLEVYGEASFGWAYWTLKNDRKHWDFAWNIRNDYLQYGTIPRPHFQSLLKHLFSSFLSKSNLKHRKLFLQVIHSAGKNPEKLYSLVWHLSLSLCITCYNTLDQIFQRGKLIIK